MISHNSDRLPLKHLYQLYKGLQFQMDAFVWFLCPSDIKLKSWLRSTATIAADSINMAVDILQCTSGYMYMYRGLLARSSTCQCSKNWSTVGANPDRGRGMGYGPERSPGLTYRNKQCSLTFTPTGHLVDGHWRTMSASMQVQLVNSTQKGRNQTQSLLAERLLCWSHNHCTTALHCVMLSIHIDSKKTICLWLGGIKMTICFNVSVQNNLSDHVTKCKNDELHPVIFIFISPAVTRENWLIYFKHFYLVDNKLFYYSYK